MRDLQVLYSVVSRKVWSVHTGLVSASPKHHHLLSLCCAGNITSPSQRAKHLYLSNTNLKSISHFEGATMSARFGIRATNALRQPAFRQNLNTNFRFAQRRAQSTAAEAGEASKNESGFSKFFNSPVGPKTVHFWAPIMKVRYFRRRTGFREHRQGNRC